MNNTPQKTQSVITILGVQGRAEWESSRECLSLDFYVRTVERIHLESILLPHDCEELGARNPITKQHIAGFLHTLDRYYIELEGEEGSYFPSSLSRGYINIFPADCLPWFDDEQQELKAFLKQAYFPDLLKGEFKAPLVLEKRVEALKPQIKAWIATEELQSYLRGKALDMGNFWASKVGSRGESGDDRADMLHLLLRSTQPQTSFTALDAEAFMGLTIAKDAMAWFNSGRVPFYDTDYGVGHTLGNALREGGLGELAKALPWKTWKHFDFSDAPVFSL